MREVLATLPSGRGVLTGLVILGVAAWCSAQATDEPADPDPAEAAQAIAEGPIRVSTSIFEFKSVTDPLIASAVRTGSEIPWPADARLPSLFRSTPRLFQITVEPGNQTRQFLLDDAQPPGLYIDLEGQGDFSNAARISGRRLVPDSRRPQVRLYRFGPLTIHPGTARTPKAYVEIAGNVVRICPGEYASARVPVGGRLYSLMLVDRNLNGSYDDVMPIPPPSGEIVSCDMLCIDHNQNGRFERVERGPWEIQPLTPQVVLNNCRFGATVQGDGSEIELEPVADQVGFLQVARQMDLLLVGEAGFVQLPRGTRWTLPVGEYHCRALSIIAQSETHVWRYQADEAQLGQISRFEIEAREALDLPAGAGLKPVAATGDSHNRTVRPASLARLREGEILQDDADIR
jgi:hypothetical protein